MRIAITGVGVVAPNGIGKEAFWQNCLAGRSGIKPVTRFDAHPYRCRHAGEITDLSPEDFLGARGLRTLDRTTLLALIAAKLALEDAQLPLAPDAHEDVGVVLGSNMGSLRSISDFDLDGLRDGPRYVNPAHFPNVVMNSPASQVSVRFRLQALNTTIASGSTASLDAIGYALDMLQLGRAQALLVGGTEEVCWQIFAGFYHLGALTTAQHGGAPPYAPFHAQPRGTLLGEGAVMVVLEPLEACQRRGATAAATIVGYGTAFSAAGRLRCDPEARAAVRAIREALRCAEISPDGLDFISVSANGTRACDAMESSAIQTVFGSRSATIPISAVKSVVGETFSAGGAFQVALAIGALQHGAVPPTTPFGFDGEEPAPLLPGVVHRASTAPLRTALLLGVHPTGVASALVIER
jgi:3-oxoacyl-[acyl-carrier-protein] synthase II